jgi:hypothetical protein
MDAWIRSLHRSRVGVRMADLAAAISRNAAVNIERRAEVEITELSP